jgi:hypothetical protein
VFLVLALVLGLVMTGAGRVAAVMAVGSYGLTPTTGSYEVGNNFSVVVDVNSGTEGVAGLDVFGTFDSAKLEMVSIEKVTTGGIWSLFESDFTNSQYMSFSNSAGTFSMTAYSISNTPVGVSGISGAFMKFNFKAKATGTASVNFSCTAGSISETNIINTDSLDIVDCASNDSGSYTIIAGTGGDSDPAPTLVPGEATVAPTAGELPQTGSLTQTLGMIVFGTVTFLGALMLRWL